MQVMLSSLRRRRKPLPQVLEDVGLQLRDAATAWELVRTAPDEVSLRQYASETEMALKYAAAFLDEWFTFGDTPHVAPEDADWGPF